MRIILTFFITLFLAPPAFTAELTSALDQNMNGVMSKVIDWRHHFHQFPELSNREYKTQKSIADALTEMGLEPNLDYGITGVTAFIRGQNSGPLIALRADIDGLPVTEQLNLPFSSKEKTTYQGNEIGVMHACGHDAHIAILLGVASFLSQNTDKLNGDIMLIFQPAEEGAPAGEDGGAELMLKQGLFELEKPDAIFGLHVSNLSHGTIMLKPGPAMASAEAFRINIEGKQTHGSRPWEGADPIVAAFNIGTTLQTIVSRRLNLLDSQAVVSVGIMKAGTRNNIIPQHAMLEGTIRTFQDSYADQIRDEIKLIAENVAAAHHATATVDFKIYGGYPVTFNDLDLSKKYGPVLKKAADGNYYEALVPRTGAEDFSFFAQQVPGLFFFLGVNPPEAESMPTNHSPYFYIDDAALDNGVKAFVSLVEEFSVDFNKTN
ncbi:MAG: N-acyl-L-amino acid amidohydrolase [SAR86 cluster bacterium BACL1 MAG-121105-bin34]|jgi:amidohydrolase|nr:MAG: N-acyl-L-amino acid amidohydrolase [SAR86 cluster bacterium BACL1 MAG-120828-bin5]KRO97813.1 MAG: N-acyl-L-amino acid amidohydrolase [SAR86 cluster bacterium BACL1 MAG-120823-bin87]KRP09406.1 MAG: N-acyl-L-amino acid amidohydrolase [SAR86 cluster bacterium BACL1 MAG-121004-bin11]KRP10814.1 MAG: N-acyl-L-amino acid amidohydrolase [SAR86 cluster bacterium BACL1 MAG-121105-bin34]KRP16258.1 MAG: N-acyl-L-amino acid amidohydrolase [SAR86 cluster bacterium BACL1 MAG-121128-bin56]KRP19922.1 M